MSHSANEDNSRRTKAESVLTDILDELDARSSTHIGSNRRAVERFRYRKNRLVAWVQQPGDATPKKHAVIPRNLSEGGVGFLMGGFVHTGSKVTVQLITLHGTWHDIEGVVATCSLVQGSLHEVSVNFLTSIQPSIYCSDAIHPRVLIVDDDPFVIRLAKVLLTKLNAEVTCATNGQEAIDTALSGTFDVIMMDIEMPVKDGLDATRELRSKGYCGKIVAATARTQPADRRACLDAGCDDFLPKPYQQETLARLLESVNQEPVFSTLADDPTMTDVVNDFIGELPTRIRKLAEAAQNDNVEALELIARQLKGEGSMYGLEIITEMATGLETALLDNPSIEAARPKLNELVQLCEQVRSTSISNTVVVPN